MKICAPTRPAMDDQTQKINHETRNGQRLSGEHRMLFLIVQQPQSHIHVDTQLELWQILAAVVAFAMAWGVVLYRINSHSKQHEKHFDHAGDLRLHQTPQERTAIADRVAQTLDDHEALDNFRFGNLDKKVDTLQVDVKEILGWVQKAQTRSRARRAD